MSVAKDRVFKRLARQKRVLEGLYRRANEVLTPEEAQHPLLAQREKRRIHMRKYIQNFNPNTKPQAEIVCIKNHTRKMTKAHKHIDRVA